MLEALTIDQILNFPAWRQRPETGVAMSAAVPSWIPDDLPVFPCGEDKRPLTGSGFNSRKPAARWRAQKALAPSWALVPADAGWTVVDVDVFDAKRNEEKHGGWNLLAEFGEAAPALFDTSCVPTPSGGRHFFFSDDKPRGNAHSLPEHVDVRSGSG